LIHLTYSQPRGGIKHVTLNEAWIWQDALVSKEYRLPNLVPALDAEEDLREMTYASRYVPVKDEPFIEHVRDKIAVAEKGVIKKLFKAKPDVSEIKFEPEITAEHVVSMEHTPEKIWIGTKKGLYVLDHDSKRARRQRSLIWQWIPKDASGWGHRLV
jgi:hypothetical protein